MIRRLLAFFLSCMMVFMPFFVVAQETPPLPDAPATEPIPITTTEEDATDTDDTHAIPPTDVPTKDTSSSDTEDVDMDDASSHDDAVHTPENTTPTPPDTTIPPVENTSAVPPPPPHTPSTDDAAASPQETLPPEVPHAEPLPLHRRDAVSLERVDETVPPHTDKTPADVPPSSSRTGTLLITEILLGTSANSQEEYVEIFNTTDKPISLKGFSLKKTTKSGTESNLAAAKSLDTYTIAPQTFFVIANAAFVDTLHADALFSGKSFTIADNATITLYDDTGTIIDRVGYGSATVAEKHTAPNPPKNESIERKKINGVYADTDDNAVDFERNPCPQPGNFIPDNAAAHITISEIYPKPCAQSDTSCTYSHEFIELYNPHPFPVHLAKWRIRDASATGMHIFTADDIVPANSYRAFEKDTFGFALNDTGTETITLINPLCTPVAHVSYTTARPQLSYNIAEDGTWYWAQPTPQGANTPNPTSLQYPPLQLTEILPRPATDERANEYIEIYNPNDTPVSLHTWQLRDASVRGIYTFPADAVIPPRTFFVVYRSLFTFALNNSADTVSLIAPSGTIVSTVSYSGARKGVSYNFDFGTQTWRWSIHQSPGATNIFNNLPVAVKKAIPSKGYKNVFTAFSIKAKDADGEPLKVRWDFGDGRRSYLWKTRHKYLKNGTYHGTVRIQDGSEDLIIPFTIIITGFPRHDVAITELFPNPDGRDTGAEYITLVNRSKKSLDLFGWSIATGTTKKKLVNHPIRAHVTLPKNGTLRITRDHAAITLPNTTGVVELRAPDGKTIDTVTYAPPGKSVPIDALYISVNNTWQWRIVPNAKKRAQAYAIAAAAATRENDRVAQNALRDALYTLVHDPATTTPAITSAPQWLYHIAHTIGTLNHYFTVVVAYLTLPRTPHTDTSVFPLYTAAHMPSVCNARAYIAPPRTPFPLCDTNDNTLL